MAEETTLLRQHNKALDRGLKGVMPDTWEGHGRLTIRESDVIDSDMEPAAIEKMDNLVDKKGYTPEKAANALIRAVQKKRQE